MVKDTKYKYRSPLKFLNSYNKEDHHLFFGRDAEVNEVFALFEKTNLVIIYGPSGSGKSSVALCGLTNRYHDWRNIVIRKNDNIIDSFFESIEELFRKNDCKKLKSIFLKFVKEEGALKENARGLNFRQIKEKRAELSAELKEVIDQVFSEIKFIPFFIFDQFEELFVNGSPSEINSFSLLLSIITSKILMANVVLCIQTEFFVHLLELENKNPHILNYKCAVNDPERKNVAEIIRRTFEHFEINKYEVDDDGIKGPELTEETKELRIDKIIDKIDDDGVSGRIHLPFLQIYLNKLYVEDYIRTYTAHKNELLNPEGFNFAERPLEFNEQEIDDYGSIDKILRKYINDINFTLHTIKNDIEGRGHEQTVVIFLAHFISKKNTIRSVEIAEERNSEKLRIVDQEILSSVKSGIWGHEDDSLDASVSDIINELVDSRILKRRGKFLELSHNLLVGIIKKIPVEKDNFDYHLTFFESSFEAYNKQLKDEKSKPNLLSSGWINRMEKDKNKILKSEKKKNIRKAKKEFWRKSKNQANKWKIITAIGAFLVLISMVITMILGFQKIESDKKKVADAELIEKQNKELESKNLISDKLTKAYSHGKSDITKMYKELLPIDSIIKADNLNWDDFQLVKNTKNELVNNYSFSPFYKNKIALPKDVKQRHIRSTKTRSLKNGTKDFILFAETKDNLFSRKVYLDSTGTDTAWNSLGTRVSSFTPYYNSDDNIRVIYSDRTGTYETGYEFKEDRDYLLKEELDNIQYINDSTCIGTSATGKILNKFSLLRKIDILIGKKEGLDFDIIKKIPDSRNDEIIALITETSSGEQYLYKINPHGGRNVLVDTFRLSQKRSGFRASHISAIQVVAEDKTILFADGKVIYSIPLDDFHKKDPPVMTKIITRHKEQINSIESYKRKRYSLKSPQKIIFEESIIMIGSADKTASLYLDNDPNGPGDEILIIKELKGHEATVLNVSLYDDGNYGLTSGEDGTINIWDLNQIAEKTKIVREIKQRRPLKIKHYNSRLYVGFTFANFYRPKNRGYLVHFSDTLDNITKFPSNPSASGHFNRFDFISEDEILGVSNWGRKLYKLNSNGVTQVEDFPSSVVTDLNVESVGSSKAAAIATYQGLLYYKDVNNLIDPEFFEFEKNQVINSVDIHPTRGIVLAASDNGDIYLWDPNKDILKNGDLKQRNPQILTNHSDRVKDACFSKNGDYFVSGSWDNTAIIWAERDDGTYEPFGDPLSEHTSDIEDIEISDNDIIATASSDKRVLLYQYNRGQDTTRIDPISSLIKHDHGVRSVTFDVENKTIYTADRAGIIKMWKYEEFEDIIKQRMGN